MCWPFVLFTGLCLALLELVSETVMVNVLSPALAGPLLKIAGLAARSWRQRWCRDRQ
jgi:hypothetical protein